MPYYVLNDLSEKELASFSPRERPVLERIDFFSCNIYNLGPTQKWETTSKERALDYVLTQRRNGKRAVLYAGRNERVEPAFACLSIEQARRTILVNDG